MGCASSSADKYAAKAPKSPTRAGSALSPSSNGFGLAKFSKVRIRKVQQANAQRLAMQWPLTPAHEAATEEEVSVRMGLYEYAHNEPACDFKTARRRARHQSHPT